MGEAGDLINPIFLTNLSLKWFCENQVNNNWDIADIEFMWVVVVVGGVQSHFHVKPKWCFTEFSFGCVGVLIILNSLTTSLRIYPIFKTMDQTWILLSFIMDFDPIWPWFDPVWTHLTPFDPVCLPLTMFDLS